MKAPFCTASIAGCLAALLIAMGTAQAALTPPGLWQDADETLLAGAGERLIVPDRYRTLALDTGALRALLAKAPMEWSGGTPAVVALPLPDGSEARFRFEESPILQPGLAARYPEIKTYRGQGIDDPAATARFGWTAAGFHAIVLSPSGTVYVDPYRRGDVEHYISYFKRDFRKRSALSFRCKVHKDGGSPVTSVTGLGSASPEGPDVTFSGLSSSGGTLRTYRLAQAANFEYTLFHSGLPNLPSKQAAIHNGIIPTINRVNAIYERELAVHMNLIDDLEAIVWDHPADPYVNEEGTSMLATNQVTLDTLIGNESYDIGHVFSTGGGGVAGLGVVCDDTAAPLNQKAWGVTGLPEPVGDPFDVDFVAHEMGHQFGGNHTFNGTTGSCTGNANAATAFEVGSGSTIQAYAGICTGQNLQPHSDDYFHNISYVEMRAHVTGPADACAVKTATGNTPPEVEAGAAFTIPRQTPFTLTASGSDANGDALTYCWEELDLGPLNDGRTDNGSSPILRSFPPTASPSRTFPRLSDLLGNTTTYGELLPSTTRNMRFRVTARDNRAGGGEVDWDETHVQVTTAAGPFRVSAPNGGEVWTGDALATVVWDVANTTLPPVSAAAVNIRLSTDGGVSFPILLAAGVANDGTEQVEVPNLATAAARIKVEGAGNIFFDLSNAAFTIQPGSGRPFAADDQARTAQDTPVRIPVLANDSDPNGDPLTIAAVQSPTARNGTAAVDGNGTPGDPSDDRILYTPAAGFHGTDTFTYTVSDGASTDVGTVSVTVDRVSVACQQQPPGLAVAERADALSIRTGDGDGFLDNCEAANLAFSVANTGGVGLTNVRIVAIRPISHPAVSVQTALPAAVAASLPSPCAGGAQPATASFAFTASGLSHGDTLLFEIDVTADQLAPAVHTATLAVRETETDAAKTTVTFGFEQGLEGWQVVRGTFQRTDLGGGANGPGSFYLASSAALPDQCDQVRSPVLRLSPTSTLTLSSQFATEPFTTDFFDRANVGFFEPRTGARTTVIPDGGDRPYNVPQGSPNGTCVTENQAGWAGAGPGWRSATWSADALGLAGIGPGGRELAIDVAHGTDASFEGAGFWFDEVTVTDVLALGPDRQSDVCGTPPCPATATGRFADDFEPTPAPGWAVRTPANAGPLSPAWRVVADPLAHSASQVFASDATTLALKDDRLVAPPQDLSPTSRLVFWHRFLFEDGFDGGVLEASKDGGATWTDVIAGGGSFLEGGYNGAISPADGSPIAGRSAWTGLSSSPGAMSRVEVDLAAFAGRGVLVRWRLAADPLVPGSLPGLGWWIDDVEFTNTLETPTSCPHAPVASDDTAVTDEGAPVEIDVLANDGDANGDGLTVGAVTQGTQGGSVVNLGDRVTYTPPAGFSSPPADTFTYTACDPGGLCDEATVTVTVHDVNHAPTPADDAATTQSGTAVTIPVLANDTDPDGDDLALASVGDPAHGTATANGDGTVTYTPDPGFTGADELAYTVSDGELTATATVRVTVEEQPAPGQPQRVGGSGSIPLGSGTASFGVNARAGAASPQGRIRYDAGSAGPRLKGTVVTTTFPSPTRAELAGPCELADGSVCTYQAAVEDHGEPGVGRDRFSIRILDAAGNLVHQAEGTLASGNVRIH